MNIYAPYTYLIGWSAHNKWYYGVRYAKNCHPSDLWVSYFTSSKYVKQFQSQYGDPDVIEIRKTFDSMQKAMEWEYKVLTKLNVIEDSKWLNRTTNRAFPDQTGRKLSEQHKMKIGKACKGKKMTEEQKEKMRESHRLNKQKYIDAERKKWENPAFREKMCSIRKTQKQSAETKAKIAEANRIKAQDPVYREKLRLAAIKRWAAKSAAQ